MKNQKGFTLVEILAVIAILGILMTTAGISVFGILNSSSEELIKEQVKTLKDTAITYINSKHYYLEKCPDNFDPKNPPAKEENSCYRKVSVASLIEEKLFENKNDVCDPTKNVIVYKINKGNYSEFASYVPDDICKY